MPNIQGGIDGFLGIIGLTASAFFPAWPLVVISSVFRRRKRILANIAAAWGGMLVLWLLSLLSSNPIKSYFIPEPQSTALFFAAGVALVAIWIGTRYWQRRDIQIKADAVARVDDLHRLSPAEFENMVVEMYSAMGHKARRTGTVGDHGVDVEVQASNGEKWVVQCKRWRGNVGEPVVRDFHGMMQHEKADRGFIITAGRFTEQAKKWAAGKPITLLDGAGFLASLRKARQSARKLPVSPESAPIAAAEAIAAPRCPKCDGEMVLRVAKRGATPGEEFWGCSNYPQCRGVRKKQ